MKDCTRQRIEALDDMTVAELRDEYARVWGEPTRSRHKRHLQKRIAWGLQANDEGGLSERARRRAEELANEADLRLLAPRGRRTEVHPFKPPKPPRDPRLPMPGTVLTREYRGETIAVTVLDEGFEYAGTVYLSLSAVALPTPRIVAQLWGTLAVRHVNGGAGWWKSPCPDLVGALGRQRPGATRQNGPTRGAILTSCI